MPSPAQKVIATISFVGNNFKGFQYQKKGKSVQDEIEKCLRKIDLPTRVYGCSRTDSGVHARRFVIHFNDIDKKRSAKEIFKGLNSILPNEISVLKVSKTLDNFHARYSTTIKTYRYFLYTKDVVPPPIKPFLCQLNFPFDETKFEEISKLIVGRHNFFAFTTKEGRKKETIREIEEITIFERKPLISIQIKGKSFLHRMVRFLVSMMVMFSRNKIGIDFVSDALKAKVNFLPFPALEAKGLHLWDVETKHYEILDFYEEELNIPLYPFESINFNLLSKVSYKVG